MVQFQHESEGLRTKKGEATISSPKAISSRSKKSRISVKSRDWKRPVILLSSLAVGVSSNRKRVSFVFYSSLQLQLKAPTFERSICFPQYA